MRSSRGITLLEMMVATTILAIAVVGLMSGLSSTTHNAARLQDYDRAVQLGRLRMNDLMLDFSVAPGASVSGYFDPSFSAGMDAGWKARVTEFERPPVYVPGEAAIDRVDLEVWWKSGQSIRTFTLEGYRYRVIRQEDIVPEAKK